MLSCASYGLIHTTGLLIDRKRLTADFKVLGCIMCKEAVLQYRGLNAE